VAGLGNLHGPGGEFENPQPQGKEATDMTVRELAIFLLGIGIGWTVASAVWTWWTKWKPRDA